MTIEPFKLCVIRPINRETYEQQQAKTLLAKRVYNMASAIFSAFGNFPFYGVAASFGDQYASGLGIFFGTSEYFSYWSFRINNFLDIRYQFFSDAKSETRSSPLLAENLSASLVEGSKEERFDIPLTSQNRTNPDSFCVRNWKLIARNVGISALGILAQFPIMVLVYYGNGENLAYPIISGTTESAFTILSLLLTIRSAQTATEKKPSLPELENKKKLLIDQMDRFLKELPVKYKDPGFMQKIEEIFSDYSLNTEEQMSKNLLQLICEAKGVLEPEKGVWDRRLTYFSKGFGGLIALYLMVVNSIVTYQGIRAWKEDQEFLAVLTTFFVGIANIALLTQLCVNSAESYYQGIRDLLKGQYQYPLAGAVSPIPWFIGRTIMNFIAWCSFGTTATGAQDSFPTIKNVAISLAPFSSAALLHDNANTTVDESLLWIHSKRDPKIKLLALLNKYVSQFKETISEMDLDMLDSFSAFLKTESPPIRERQDTERPFDSLERIE